MKRSVAAILLAGSLAGCQSGTTTGKSVLESPASSGAVAKTEPAGPVAQSAAQSGGQCVVALPGGPPPRPNRASDVAKNAVGKNIARNVGRNVIANAGGMIAGPLGSVIGGAVATQVVRTEQDLHGKWNLTDGSPSCGCEVEISTATGLVPAGFGNNGYKLKDAKGGKIRNISCTNSQLAAAARFALGHSFTGYEAELVLAASNGNAVAYMKRDGINYFSGSLADGTPVTMWRRN